MSSLNNMHLTVYLLVLLSYVMAGKVENREDETVRLIILQAITWNVTKKCFSIIKYFTSHSILYLFCTWGLHYWYGYLILSSFIAFKVQFFMTVQENYISKVTKDLSFFFYDFPSFCPLLISTFSIRLLRFIYLSRTFGNKSHGNNLEKVSWKGKRSL